MSSSVSSTAVAKYLLEKAKSCGIVLSPMKLLKLVYLCEGYNLAYRDGESLIKEEVQAWQYGPVIPDLYHATKHFRSSPVTSIVAPHGESLSADQASVVDAVFNAYKNYSAVQLSDITHRPGTPWSKTWEQGNGHRNLVIPTAEIHDHYRGLISQ